MFYHYFEVQGSKIPTIAGHLNALRGDLGYSEVEEIGNNLGTALSVKIHQSEKLKKLIEDY